MSINPESYKKAAYPPPLRPPYLSDEDISYLLDKSHRKRKPASPASNSPEDTSSQPAKAMPAKAKEA